MYILHIHDFVTDDVVGSKAIPFRQRWCCAHFLNFNSCPSSCLHFVSTFPFKFISRARVSQNTFNRICINFRTSGDRHVATSQEGAQNCCLASSLATFCRCGAELQGGAIKTGPPSHCKYSETPWPNCVEIGELLQYYMLNRVINILFKNFIALWRHLAKTQLLSFIHINRFEHHTVPVFFARWRHSAMKFLNKKLMTVFSI